MQFSNIWRLFSTPRNILLQIQHLAPLCAGATVISKPFSATPVLQDYAISKYLPDYLRARRGPFTPEEKRGSGHMMSASNHWKIERVVAVSLCGIMPLALFYQGGMMDHMLTTFVYLHGFWGIDGVLKDYLVKFIPWIQKVWWALAIVGFAGLLNFNYNDVGVCKAVKMIWAL